MKPDRLIHPELVAALAAAGHGDTIVISDAGLKIPRSAHRIDLGVTCGVPTFLQVVKAVLPELVVEAATVATEFSTWNPEVYAATLDLLPVAPDAKPHADLMAEAAESAYLYVKSGECTAYANVVLTAGVSYIEEAMDLYESIHGSRP